MSIEENKMIARQLTELLDEANEEKLLSLLSPGFLSHFAGFPQPITREQYIQINRLARSAFSDLERSVDDMVAEDDKVAVRITARGTHTGTFQGIPATGRVTEITGISIRRITDGKVAEEWVINDQLGLLQQLGVIDLPSQANR